MARTIMEEKERGDGVSARMSAGWRGLCRLQNPVACMEWHSGGEGCFHERMRGLIRESLE